MDNKHLNVCCAKTSQNISPYLIFESSNLSMTCRVRIQQRITTEIGFRRMLWNALLTGIGYSKRMKMNNELDVIKTLEELEQFLISVEAGGLGLEGVEGVGMATNNSDLVVTCCCIQ